MTSNITNWVIEGAMFYAHVVFWSIGFLSLALLSMGVTGFLKWVFK